MNRILVAVDGSLAANDALDHALELARESGAQLTAVCVQVMVVRGGALGAPAVLVTAPHEPEPTAVLSDAKQRARAAGVEIATLSHAGSPAAQICATAEELDVDLVVVGSRCRGDLRSVLLGSVSRAVVAHARRPVMVVKHAPVRQLAMA